tara:strand:- start:79 stop:270 length:192 start_codon:yes stop_codon:yes gene_type:complete
MKHSSVLIASSLFIIMALTSCGKCQICTQDSEPELRLCRGDYDSNTQYGLALDLQEAGGYDCR